MSKVCVVIEGQLRGAKTCGPTIRKHLIDKLGADLYFCIQNFENHREENLKYYGPYKQCKVYDNPEPDFGEVFNGLSKIYGYEPDRWRANFSLINDGNWTLGFNKPGTCIRRMFNRLLIYDMLKDSSYEWFIILRSDLYFVDDFYDLQTFEKDTLYHYEKGGWRGINNNLIIFHRDLLEKVLLYIKNFLNLKILAHYILNTDRYLFPMNEEIFFMFQMGINQVKTKGIPTKWFISADSDDISTWAKIQKDENGYLYKYDYDHDDLKSFLSLKKNNSV